MGTLGPGVFDDDLAMDVRGDYRALIMDGVDDDEATNVMLERYADVIADAVDAAPVFWVALAVSQSQVGRLDHEVRRRALAVIDEGTDLARWADADAWSIRARQRALTRVRHRLEGPQPAPKTLRRPRRYTTDLAPGDVLMALTPRNNYVLVRVVRLDDMGTDTFPVIRWLWWGRPQPPDHADLSTIPDSTEAGLIHVNRSGRTDYRHAGFIKVGSIAPRPGDSTDPIRVYTTWPALLG